MDYDLQSITNALVKAGGDLTICNPKGYSSCSLIFDSKFGMQYLEEFVCPYIDLITFEEMETMDAWLLAALARSYPTFQTVLESQLLEWRTPKEISSSRVPIADTITKFDIPHQIDQLKAATAQIRTAFVRVICKRGNIAMLAPFLDCGIDLDERCGDNHPYLREATYAGNMDVTLALLEAGASIHLQTINDLSKSIITVTSPVIALIHRWKVKGGRSEELRDIDMRSEFWILQELLEHPTFHDTDALLVALQFDSPTWIIKALLDAGCGRQGDGPPVSRRQRFSGSEVIAAVKYENQHLPLLISYGLGLEYEDRLGFTALLHALDLRSGPKDFAKMLIDAGANVVKRTSSGYTPLQLARENLKAPHPRMVSRKWQEDNDKDPKMLKAMTLEQDQEIYNYLSRIVRERRVGHGAVAASKSIHSLICLLGKANFRPGWMVATVKSMPSWYEDLREAHSRLKQDSSTLDLVLAGLGLLIGFTALLSITLWQFIWKTGWKILAKRKTSNFERVAFLGSLILSWTLKRYYYS